MPEESKRLRVMAGPNGSGKTTILKEVRNNFYSGPFVNADEIERTFREKSLVNMAAEFSLEVADESFTRYLQGPGKSWIEKREDIRQ